MLTRLRGSLKSVCRPMIISLKAGTGAQFPGDACGKLALTFDVAAGVGAQDGGLGGENFRHVFRVAGRQQVHVDVVADVVRRLDYSRFAFAPAAQEVGGKARFFQRAEGIRVDGLQVRLSSSLWHQ